MSVTSLAEIGAFWNRPLKTGTRKWLILERETGLEPATSSLGNCPEIENKEHGVYGANS
jgi:hypothetical protein